MKDHNGKIGVNLQFHGHLSNDTDIIGKLNKYKSVLDDVIKRKICAIKRFNLNRQLVQLN